MSTTLNLVRAMGVADIPPRTSPLDPGYDAATVEAHLQQSGHLMSRLKLSTAQWLIAAQPEVERKIRAAKRAGVPVVTGGTPFEVSQEKGLLDRYFELCASMGVDRIEIAEGFTRTTDLVGVVGLARRHGLEVQAELGDKHSGAFDPVEVKRLIERGTMWLSAGARQLIVEARESAENVGIFDKTGTANFAAAENLVGAFGLETLVFEAPNKKSQFELMTHFGKEVQLSNVRLEEVLRVEIYRRGLHADSYQRELADAGPSTNPTRTN